MTAAEPRPMHTSRIAGIILGIGLGGFVDGIVLHRIMHWPQRPPQGSPLT